MGARRTHQFLLLTAAVCAVADLPSEKEHVSSCYNNAAVSVLRLRQCLDMIKTFASNDSMFWFGERWKATCTMPHNRFLFDSYITDDFATGKNLGKIFRALQRNKITLVTVLYLSDVSVQKQRIDCDVPRELQSYRSLGGRLLRVNLFDKAYLRALRILPQMVFVSEPGGYIGCDHEYAFDRTKIIYSFPGMKPVASWHLRKKPKVFWPEMEASKSYTLAIVDAARGQLHYLAFNYPGATQYLNSYPCFIGFYSTDFGINVSHDENIRGLFGQCQFQLSPEFFNFLLVGCTSGIIFLTIIKILFLFS
ncbi:unnamed protein product [Soboliphyme baturini]|uniref:Secreted protein n=1 Tax=Soboliphyme baturini TaxID=241478 RepID=A0A183ILA7_9BILA|nr:unnamed protein product [Soboliphyme baturini]